MNDKWLIKFFKLCLGVSFSSSAILFWPALHPLKCFDQRKPGDATRQLFLHPESKVAATDSRWWLFRHTPPSLSFRPPSLKPCLISSGFFWNVSAVCHGGLNANVWEISASKRVTFQQLFEELFRKGLEGEKQERHVCLNDSLGRHSAIWTFDREKEQLGNVGLNSGGRMLNDQSQTGKLHFRFHRRWSFYLQSHWDSVCANDWSLLMFQLIFTKN